MKEKAYRECDTTQQAYENFLFNEINPSRATVHFTRCRRISLAKQISQIPQGIYFVEKKSHTKWTI